MWVNKRPFNNQSILGRWIMLKYNQWYVRNVLVETEKGGYICHDGLIYLHDGVVSTFLLKVCCTHTDQTEFCNAVVSAGEISVKWDM